MEKLKNIEVTPGQLNRVFSNSLHILDINILSDVLLAKILSHSMELLITQLTVSLAVLISLMKFHLSVVELNSWTDGVLLRRAFPTPILYRLCLCFLSAFSVFQVPHLCL